MFNALQFIITAFALLGSAPRVAERSRRLPRIALDLGARPRARPDLDLEAITNRLLDASGAPSLKGRLGLYVGSNLARGDLSAAKTIGIKLHLD